VVHSIFVLLNHFVQIVQMVEKVLLFLGVKEIVIGLLRLQLGLDLKILLCQLSNLIFESFHLLLAAHGRLIKYFHC
jgi:hypothetical protein